MSKFDLQLDISFFNRLTVARTFGPSGFICGYFELLDLCQSSQRVLMASAWNQEYGRYPSPGLEVVLPHSASIPELDGRPSSGLATQMQNPGSYFPSLETSQAKPTDAQAHGQRYDQYPQYPQNAAAAAPVPNMHHRICGFYRNTFWLALVLLLVLVGGIVGGVTGGLMSRKSSSSATATTSVPSAVGSSPTSIPTGLAKSQRIAATISGNC
jgi:hypothetical protein